MAKHEITTHVPSHEALNGEIRIEVRSDDRLLGVIEVHQGAIDWRPTYHQHKFRLTWEKFDQAMRDTGKKLPN